MGAGTDGFHEQVLGSSGIHVLVGCLAGNYPVFWDRSVCDEAEAGEKGGSSRMIDLPFSLFDDD